MPRIDDVKGCMKCDDKHYARGLCRKHYRQLYTRKTETLYNKKWRKLNPDKIKIYKTNEYINNKDTINLRNNNNYLQNRKHRIELAKIWAKDNPKSRLRIMSNHLKRYSIVFKLTNKQYKWALMTWSKIVKNNGNNKCAICGNNKEVNAHHLIYKKYVPELSLNPNNGIILCKEHHKEVHYA